MVIAANAVVYLMRHGETGWNAAGRFQGRLDSPLTETGRAQARACGRRLAGMAGEIGGLCASPLGRVRETVAIIRDCGSLPEPRWDDRLCEVSVGSWDGLTHYDIDAMWPGSLDGTTPFDWFFRSPDGESYDAALARARDWLADVRGVVVAVSHALLGRIIRGAHLGLAREEALALPVPQDVIWRLAKGRIEPVAT